MRQVLSAVLSCLVIGIPISVAQAQTLLDKLNPFKKNPPAERIENESVEPGVGTHISDDTPSPALSRYEPLNEPEPEMIEPEEPRGFPFPTLKMPKFEMPKFELPKRAAPPRTMRRPAPQGPSTWDKFANSTKSFFSKTKETLMPWADNSNDQPSRSTPGPTLRTTRRPPSNRTTEEKPSFFSSWLKPKEEEKEIRSVNDFLSLPQPSLDR